MIENDVHKQLELLCVELRSISPNVTLQSYKIESLNSEIENLKRNLKELQKLSHELDKQLNEQKTETKNTKKTLMTVGAIVSILVAVFTYYSEYLSDRPSPLEQQKNIDSLWSKYNNLIDRLVDEKHIK